MDVAKKMSGFRWLVHTYGIAKQSHEEPIVSRILNLHGREINSAVSEKGQSKFGDNSVAIYVYRSKATPDHDTDIRYAIELMIVLQNQLAFLR